MEDLFEKMYELFDPRLPENEKEDEEFDDNTELDNLYYLLELIDKGHDVEVIKQIITDIITDIKLKNYG